MKIISGLWIGIMCLSACHVPNKLETAIETELNSGLKNDSLFLGISFGWTQKEFFDHCWKLNKQQIIGRGSQNASVLYSFKDDEGYNVDFHFYPEYDEGKAYKYIITFSYNAWAPWNKQLQSDDLLGKLPGIFQNWYGGNDIFNVKDKTGEVIYKIDGNRQIELRIKDERLIVGTITDLSHYAQYSD